LLITDGLERLKGLNKSVGSLGWSVVRWFPELKRLKRLNGFKSASWQLAAGRRHQTKGVRSFGGSVVRKFRRLKGLKRLNGLNRLVDGLDRCHEGAVYLDSHAALEEVDRNDQEALVRFGLQQDPFGACQ